MFSSIIYLTAPYSGSIGSTPRYLGREGEVIRSVVTMEDRPWLRNPFGSIHAVALTNLGELASGVCMVTAIQHVKGVKGIPVRIDTEYFQKARGTVTASSQVSLKDLVACGSNDFKVTSILVDKKGVTVATCSVTWSLKNATKPDISKTGEKID